MKIWIGMILLLGILDGQCELANRRRILKPFLVPMMMVLAMWGGVKSELLYAALFFGWIGDLFLIGKDRKKFICGLVSFLLGHLCYVLLFASFIRFFSWVSVVGALAYGLWWGYVFHRLKEHVHGKLRIVVAVYMAFLACMSWLALCTGNRWLWIGSLSFCISDQLIAYRTFLNGCGKGVMETYVLAQLLLVIGMINPTL